MVQVISNSSNGMDVYCYDDVTDADEVNETLHDIVREHVRSKNIWVITGTHGNDDGTVDETCREIDFKEEDLDTANVTSSNIKIWDYQLLAGNLTWRQYPGRALRRLNGLSHGLLPRLGYSVSHSME